MLGSLWGCLASQSNGVLHCRKAAAFLYSSCARLPAPGETSHLRLLHSFATGVPGHGHPRHAIHTLENKGLSVRAFSAKIKSLCCLKLSSLRTAAGLHSSWKCSSQSLVLWEVDAHRCSQHTVLAGKLKQRQCVVMPWESSVETRDLG